jgi:heat shock protein HslJ
MRIAMAGVLGAAVALLGAASPASAGDEEALFGKRYHSVSITKDGAPKALVEGTKLRVQFSHGDDHDSILWRAGCNFFGRQIIVTEETIDTRGGSSTEMGCPNELQRQDEFFAHFFRQDPAWNASGRELTLSTDRVTIELRRRVANAG